MPDPSFATFSKLDGNPIAIKCAPPTVIAGLRGKLPVENDKACAALTELILQQVNREHRGVFDWAPPPVNLFPKMT